MTRKCLLIGGVGLSGEDIPTGFHRIGSDFLSLYQAQRDFPLDQYAGVVFWLDEHTFDLASARDKFPSFQEVFNELGLPTGPAKLVPANELEADGPDEHADTPTPAAGEPHASQEVHPGLGPPTEGASWDSIHNVTTVPNYGGCPLWQVWSELQKASYAILLPLVERLFRGGPPIVVVHPPAVGHASPIDPHGWFSAHLSSFTTRRPEKPVRSEGDHPLVRFFNSALASYEKWEATFDVGVATPDGSLSLVGRSIPLGFSFQDYLCDEGELVACVSNEYDTGQRLFHLRGLPGGGSGYHRSILFEAGQTGILVVPAPKDARAFLDAAAPFLTPSAEAGYTLRTSPDGKMLIIGHEGDVLGQVGFRTKAARVIRHCWDVGAGAPVDLNCLNQRFGTDTVAHRLRSEDFKGHKPLYDSLFELSCDKKAIVLRKSPLKPGAQLPES